MGSIGVECIPRDEKQPSIETKDVQVEQGSASPKEYLAPPFHGDDHSDCSKGRGIHESESSPSMSPIAIVGMAVRLPGGVRSMDGFWELLTSQRDVSKEFPKDRFNIDAYYSPTRAQSIKTRKAFFLEQDLEAIDPAISEASKYFSDSFDPQQYLLLELIWECMESAGQADWQGKDIGCFVGTFGDDWLEMSGKESIDITRDRVFGANDFALANRVSYEYDLRGPSMTIKTACSASMTGLDQACQSVASGACSGAVVAGSNIILTPTMTTIMSENMVLSPEGECKTFDADANGYARGECVNAIFIKKLDDAVRDGDPIRAVIRAAASNCDGRTSKLAVPSLQAQESLIRKTYEQAGITDFSKTGLFECHGTGTATGDNVETNAIARVFGESGIHLGAVKPNVGHSEGASGLTSIIKGVLCLEKQAIPPVMRFKNPNPEIPFEEAKLTVARELTPWPHDCEERASINSFGIGGSNTHIIMESARSWVKDSEYRLARQETDNCPRLLALTAMSLKALDERINSLVDYCKTHEIPKSDLAHTLGACRTHLPYRAFASVSDVLNGDSIQFQKAQKKARCPDSLVYVFTGQGAQWPGMGRELFKAFDCFRKDIKHMDTVLQGLPCPPNWSLEDIMFKSDDPSCLSKAEFSQPLCAAIQIGLVNLLASWNIHPTAVIGHSSGEMIAAYAAKSITAETAILIAYFRGQASSHSRPGGMAGIALSREVVSGLLEDGVVVACENSPQSVVISGDRDTLDRVLTRIAEEHPDVFTSHLDVTTAYHSHNMADVGPMLENMLDGKSPFAVPEIPFYSTVLGRALTKDDPLDKTYWRKNLESPVLFSAAVQGCLQDIGTKPSCFIEMGPHCPLSGPLRQIFQKANIESVPKYLPSLHKNQDEVQDIMSLAGQLFLEGHNISLESINGPGKILTGLPPYPWDYSTRSWKESRVSKAWRHQKFPPHEILGSLAHEASDIEPFWRSNISLDNSPWLQDHEISGFAVFPATAYMAAVGEAIRQLTGSKGYTIRNLFIRNALAIEKDQKIELMTSLKSVKLTDMLDSVWYEFTIASFSGGEWTKHCTGQAGGIDEPQEFTSDRRRRAFPRKVDPIGWYQQLTRLGMNYGPHFQGMQDITADPNSETATGSIVINEEIPELEAFHLHPTLMDKALQFLTVAAPRGLARKFDRSAIPISVESITIFPSASREMYVESYCREFVDGKFVGDTFAVDHDQIVLDIKGVKCFQVDSENTNDRGRNDAMLSKVEWDLDIDFLPSLDGLVTSATDTFRRKSCKMANEYTCLLMIHNYLAVKPITPKNDHLSKYKAWWNDRMEDCRSDTVTLIPNTSAWVGMSAENRKSLLQWYSKSIEEIDPEMASITSLSNELMGFMPGILNGEVSSLDILMSSDGLKRAYKITGGDLKFEKFFSSLRHSRPRMRILEIGAGTGSTTEKVLELLQGPGVGKMFQEYCFTDISEGFFSPAREQFGHIPDLLFKALDISQDPVEQGFQESYYDLIVASNVLHATPFLQATLQNVKKLIAPGGYLFLQELNTSIMSIDFIMGLLPGWWVGQNDGRVQKPYVSPDRWDKELRSAGFSGVEKYSYENEPPYQINANMISRAPSNRVPQALQVSLLYNGEVSITAKMVEQVFLREGYDVVWVTLEDSSPGEHVISLLDLDTAYLNRSHESSFLALREFLSNENVKTIVWLTHESQMHCKDPYQSLILGVARTVRMEVATRIISLEFDSLSKETLGSLTRVYKRIQTDISSDKELDCEYSVRGDSIFTGRYYITPNLPCGILENSSTKAKRLTISTCGLLDTLHWVEYETCPPGPGEVEVDIKYASLNFKDMMVAMGFLGKKDDLGYEAAGIIRRVGPGPHSHNYNEGDRVCILGSSLIRSSAVVPSDTCHNLPPKLPLEDAATLPCVYGTAFYALVTIGDLKKGQSVLIHSACGGVGLAAIQLCRRLGAEIFVTVGNEAKTKFLIENHQIPPNRIFHSRTPAFKQNIMRETAGRGVDLFLNSLSGDCLHASWECVAEFGKMIDIGKRDIMGNGKLSLNPFDGNRSFFGLDLASFDETRMRNLKKCVEEVFDSIDKEELKPIEPKNVFEANDAQSAFRLMQTGQHMGKILVKIPESLVDISASGVESTFELSPDVAYLLVGGLGGLGIAISRYMVERGARNLVFLSRTKWNTEESRNFIEELESMGCTVDVVVGSVTEIDDVQRAASRSSLPLAGVLHLAMVIQDQMFSRMSYQEWNACLAPKVSGAENIYEVIKDRKLDFFVMVSSLSAVCGNAGQANYSAANCYLDAFSRKLHAEGFPACALNLGAVGDIGYVSKNMNLRKRFNIDKKFLSDKSLSEKEVLQAVQMAISIARSVNTSQSDPQRGAFSIGLPHFVQAKHRVSGHTELRFAPCQISETARTETATSDMSTIIALRAEIENNPSILQQQSIYDRMVEELAKLIQQKLGREEQEAAPAEMLLDSLMAIEIRSWMRKVLNMDIPTLQVIKAKTVGGLAILVLQHLKEQHQSRITASEADEAKKEVEKDN